MIVVAVVVVVAWPMLAALALAVPASLPVWVLGAC